VIVCRLLSLGIMRRRFDVRRSSCYRHSCVLVGRQPAVGSDHTAIVATLETVDLDGLGIELQTFLLIDQKLLHVLALVALQLDHLAHLGVDDDGAIARELLLDHLEDLLLVELLGQALDCGQSLATIALCGTWVLVCGREYVWWGLSKEGIGRWFEGGGDSR